MTSPITLGGFTTNGAISDTATIAPFGAVTVSDSILDDQVSATISFTAANGMLSGSGLSAGVVSNGTVTYSLSATTPAGLQAELQALTFTPTAHQGAAGSTVTTAFDLTCDGVAADNAVRDADEGDQRAPGRGDRRRRRCLRRERRQQHAGGILPRRSARADAHGGINTPWGLATDAAGDVCREQRHQHGGGILQRRRAPVDAVERDRRSRRRGDRRRRRRLRIELLQQYGGGILQRRRAPADAVERDRRSRRRGDRRRRRRLRIELLQQYGGGILQRRRAPADAFERDGLSPERGDRRRRRCV